MKTFILIPLLIWANIISGQKALDTLYANEKMNVALFFPGPIRQGITGSPNFVFTYNRENGQYFGLLQAQPGQVSNLLVITQDCRVYAYILKYGEVLPNLNYFIDQGKAIGTERPLKPDVQPGQGALDSLNRQRDYFGEFSGHLLKSNYRVLANKRKGGIQLQLQKIVYHGDATYLVVQIANSSGIDFEVDFLDVHRVIGNKGKKASFQKLAMEPVYIHDMPTKIEHGKSHRLVYVLPKFVLGDREKLQLELQERKGSRKVVLDKRARGGKL